MDIEPYNSRLEKFFNEVAVLQHYQRLSANIAKQTIGALQARDNDLASLDSESREILGSSVSLFSFYSPYTGIIHPYSHKKLNLKETAKLVHLHKNKQYQWLLVEAYELFEDFVVSLYEFTRGESADFRLSKDRDAIVPRGELKKKVPQIIDMFRKKLPELAKIEVENKTDTNLRLHICMAEKFRHIIVHKNGKTIDPESMVDEILKRANLASDKAREPAAKAAISNYVGVNEAAGLIILVEQPVFNYGGIAMDINRHENLLNSLLAHALVMSQSLINHFGKA
ncbi:hypothetical protein BOC36_18645 [Burkholderia pseudomallei]|uniref:hypothetical protein n=1 Tax=Burkholderia pseudomallei TaxID=28450 RepID=UPI000A1A1F1B|nr:hypothetical protein [Burkholderia pseudomallei]ARK54914.1 hypothetical protein BOC36_18645 [Burkholderia pseudomallei]